MNVPSPQALTPSLAYCFSGAGGAGLGRPLKIEKIFFSAPPFFCGRDSGGLLLVASPGRAGEGCEAPPGRVAGAEAGLAVPVAGGDPPKTLRKRPEMPW